MIENAYVEFLDEYDWRKQLESEAEKIEVIMKITNKDISNKDALKVSLKSWFGHIKNEVLNMILTGMEGNSKTWGLKIDTIIENIKFCMNSMFSLEVE